MDLRKSKGICEVRHIDEERVIRECPCDVKDLMLCSGSRVLEDFKGRKLIAFGGEWSVGFLTTWVRRA